MSFTKCAPLLTALALMLPLPALAGDVGKGEKVFKKCQACHTTEPDGPSRAGPNLHGVLGRKLAGLEGFAFSPAMKKMGEEGKIWDDETFLAFVENPKKMVSGTKMTFAGLKKPEERADLLAYLQSLAPAPAAPAAPAVLSVGAEVTEPGASVEPAVLPVAAPVSGG